MALGGGDGGQVQSRDLLMWGGPRSHFRGGPRLSEVAVLECGGGDDVGDVDDGAEHVLVEPVALMQPGPASGAQLVEGLAAHQRQRPAQVGDPGGAARLAANPQSSEQVSVDE